MDTLDILRETLAQTYPLQPHELDDFLAVWKPATAPRKRVLTVAGETEKYLYFIGKGSQRMYFLDDQGHEATVMFSYASSFGGVIDSFFTRQPSRFFYETLTATELLRMTYDECEALMDRHPALARMLLFGVSTAMAGVMERLVEVQVFKSEEKFRALLARSPHILQKVPHKYLANYLGIDASNFSKLLNRVRI